jgi:hypothetical protein
MFSDAQYVAAGATVVDSAGAWGADIVMHIRPPSVAEAALVGNRTLCSMIWPAQVHPQARTRTLPTLEEAMEKGWEIWVFRSITCLKRASRSFVFATLIRRRFFFFFFFLSVSESRAGIAADQAGGYGVRDGLHPTHAESRTGIRWTATVTESDQHSSTRS